MQITSAPRSRIASTFTGLACSGTQTVAAIPKRWAPYATDCPWFPVEAVITPRRRVSGSSRLVRLIPPRTLKAPVGRRFSCLTQTWASTIRSSAG